MPSVVITRLESKKFVMVEKKEEIFRKKLIPKKYSKISG